MAKTNGDPMGIANAGKGDGYMGQLATNNGPKTFPNAPVNDLDRDRIGSGDNGAYKIDKK
jgi:hypothetical protein